jgi:predicted lactoylglutathione lyase
MTIKAIDIPVIQLPVRDLEKSVAWYRDVLGLGFTFEYNPGDHEAWMNVNGGIGLGLIRCKDKEIPKLSFRNMNGEMNAVLTFRVEEIHQVYDEMKARGIEVGKMIYKEGGGYSFKIEDLDGHFSYVWGGWPKEE